MANVHDVKQCDACGVLYRDTGKDGMVFIVEGNPLYPSIAKQKWIFHDICEDCRTKLTTAFEYALPQFALDLRDKDFREVRPPDPAPIPAPTAPPSLDDEDKF